MIAPFVFSFLSLLQSREVAFASLSFVPHTNEIQKTWSSAQDLHLMRGIVFLFQFFALKTFLFKIFLLPQSSLYFLNEWFMDYVV